MVTDLPWIIAAACFGSAVAASVGYFVTFRGRARAEAELAEWRAGDRVRVRTEPLGWMATVVVKPSGNGPQRPADPARRSLDTAE